ncbi:hypothetical protein ACIQFW_04395 [Streptomyces ardesiacus]|uniref:hypothetical protein n=1 Tax=Streptomyces ardesiacus TaxID=285564 RepID=UPI00382A19E8
MGIRSLLEHVGVGTTGRDIAVAGRVVDAWKDQAAAPRTAAEAAHQLAKRGEHVHLVSEGQGTCLKGVCDLHPVLPSLR